MDLRFVAEAPGGAATLYAVVADLTTYPRWLELVHRVQPADPEPGDGGPAFLVDLRARLGPLARSKRLRMVRVEHQPPQQVRFSRRELDGRQHAPWELSARVRDLDRPDDGTGATAGASEVVVRLHYGGHLWAAPLELALTSHVERAVPRLQAVVAAGP
jgi:hypothetical protein